MLDTVGGMCYGAFTLGICPGTCRGTNPGTFFDRCVLWAWLMFSCVMTSQQVFPLLWSSMGNPSSVYFVVNKELIVSLLLNTALNVLFCIAMNSGDEAIPVLHFHAHDRGTKHTYPPLCRTLQIVRSP